MIYQIFLSRAIDLSVSRDRIFPSYHPCDDPQFSNPTSITISSFKIYSKKREGFMVVAEEEDAPAKQQTVSRSHTFLSFLRAWQNIWRIINTITSILCQNMLIYFSMDVICSSKLTVLLKLRFWKTARILETITTAVETNPPPSLNPRGHPYQFDFLADHENKKVWSRVRSNREYVFMPAVFQNRPVNCPFVEFPLLHMLFPSCN